MKDFSNETKSKRRKAVLKVILKRYSFIIWLPLLLCISYNVGKFTLNYLIGKSPAITTDPIFDVIVFTFCGFIFLCSTAYITVGVIIILLKEKAFLKIYKKIKDEKRHFQVAVKEQMQKEMDD